MFKMFEKMIEEEKVLIKEDIEKNPHNYGTLATSEKFLKNESIKKALKKYDGLIDLSSLGEDFIKAKELFDEEVYSFEQFLKGIERCENFVRIFIKDYSTRNSIESTLNRMRKELYTLLDEEYKTVRETYDTVVPSDAMFIMCDRSNMYADYSYFWSQSEKKIYEARNSLGD